MAVTTAPEEITPATLDVVVMPNGEIICSGKTVGWVKELGRFVTPTMDPDPTLLGNIVRAALPTAPLQVLHENLTGITISKKHHGQSLVTFTTSNLNPGEVLATPSSARYVGVVVWVPKGLWPA